MSLFQTLTASPKTELRLIKFLVEIFLLKYFYMCTSRELLFLKISLLSLLLKLLNIISLCWLVFLDLTSSGSSFIIVLNFFSLMQDYQSFLLHSNDCNYLPFFQRITCSSLLYQIHLIKDVAALI